MKPGAGLQLYVDRRFSSPYAMSAFIALREKGLEFSLKTIDLHAQENRSGDFLHSSMTAR